jgi:hypothetical protein
MVNKQEVKEFLKTLECYESSSHGWIHVDEVYTTAMKMNTELRLGLNHDMIFLASYLHDMFQKDYREAHHLKGFAWVLEYHTEFDWLSWMNDNELKELAYAIKEHRASYDGEYYSKLSILLSAADRGKLDRTETIMRSFKYNCEKHPELLFKDNIRNVHQHMKDKFSSKGYARYNWVYKDFYQNDLSKFQKYFDTISYFEIEDIIMNKMMYLSLRDLCPSV